MRARNLKPGFFKNENLGQLPFEDRILFAGLWCFSDRDGFFENRPLKIAAEIFPYDRQIDPAYIESILANLAKVGLIRTVKSHGYIPSFLVHNNPHPHEAKSTVPDEIKKTLINLCNDMSLTCKLQAVKCHVQAVKCHVQAGLNPESLLLTPDSPLRTTDSTTLAEKASADFVSEQFSQFWSQYPRKEKKKNAFAVFKKINFKNGDFEKAMLSLSKQKMTEQWISDGGKYIPHPTTWLNGRRWEDEGITSDVANNSNNYSDLTPTQKRILENKKRRLENGEQE